MGTTAFGHVIMIILINTAVALLVFLVGLLQEPGRRCTTLMFSWFILICPLAAIVFISLGKLISAFYKTRDIDMDDISFSMKRDRIVLPPDREVELNYVPLEDAIAVSDIGNLRRLLINILKNNDKEMIAGITRAIDNSDTEVSHYAATAILDILSDFRANLQSLLLKVKRFPDDVNLNLFALDYIYKMLNMNIMNASEQRATIYTENEVAENLFKYNLWYMKPEYYLWMTDLMISIEDFNLAEVWASRAQKYCSDQLSSYKARLHVYYAQKHIDAFFACMTELKNTDIAVDKEMLDLFRIYG